MDNTTSDQPCGCRIIVNRTRLCPYHEGYEDGYEAGKADGLDIPLQLADTFFPKKED